MTATSRASTTEASRFTFPVLGFRFNASRITHYISRSVDIAFLAAFRFLFGLLMAGAIIRFMAKGWVRQLYLAPTFHFPYPGFEWVRPWPDALMYAHFVLLALLALGIGFGFFYRVCAVLFFFGFTYVELLDQTAYLNHYYLISLLAGLLVILPAHRAWSIDASRKPQIRVELVPAWCLNLLRFQIGIVYVFAGLAKFNADWLFRAEPLRIWLAARSDLPLIGHWLNLAWVAYAASWFGAIFDTTIVFFLLQKRTRTPAYILLILFHAATWALFNIGMFPWIMIVAATVFFPPEWPRRWIAALKFRPSIVAAEVTRLSLTPNAECGGRNQSQPRYLGCYILLGIYAALQLALPLRPYFSSQPVTWTCSGFNCAWRVMIAEKTGYAEFFAVDPSTGERRRLSLKDYITPRQEMMMAQDPYLIREMARRLADDLDHETGTPMRVTANAFATLNGRPSQQLIDPTADLGGPLGPGWILPLQTTTR